VTPDLETEVLARAIRDLTFARKARGSVDGYGFGSKQRQWIWRELMRCVGLGELPTPSIWAARLKAVEDEAQREMIHRALLTVVKHEPTTPKSALAEIQSFVRLQAAERGIYEAAEAGDKMDLDAVEGSLQDTLGRMRAVRSLKEDRRLADDWELRLKRYSEPSKHLRYPLPLPALNRLTGGGPYPGCLCLITAYTGMGKSTFSVDVGYTAAKAVPDLVVVDITTEEPEEVRQARYDARITGINRAVLLGGDLTPAEEMVFRAKYARAKHVASRIRVKELGTAASIADVEAFVREVRDQHPEAPLLINIDSGEHIRPLGKAESRRIAKSEVYRSLKALAVDPDLAPCVVWATDQLGRQAATKRSVGNHDIADSIDVSRLADLFLCIQSADVAAADEDVKSRKVILDKSRLGAVDRWVVVSDFNGGTCEVVERGEYDEGADESDDP